MNQILSNKYSYLCNFFETAQKQNRLFHSLIFHGSNQYMQYLMGLEIARILNCNEDGRSDCDCQNCRWIRENKHPAVITVSKIDNKSDLSKTVISEEQINGVLDTLINSSDYHRVFIFCDAQMKKLSDEEKREYFEFKESGYSLPQSDDEDKIWYPSGLNQNCLSSVAANSMLKSIEEPPSNVTFIFLTNNKEDLLQTIVSRSQAFYIPDVKNIVYNTSFLEKFFVDYPKFNHINPLDFSSFLLKYQVENNFEAKYIIDCIQQYLLNIAKQNFTLHFNNKVLLNMIYKDIEKTEEFKKMLDTYIKEQIVYETLAFYFTGR